MKRIIPVTFALPLAVAATFALAGCGPKQENADGNSASVPAAHVRVRTVENKSRTMTEEVLGTVRAKLRATTEARVNGRIESMPVLLGEKVRKGQLIARLDVAEIAARLEQAQASADEADRNWKRISSLYNQQGATRADYDAAQSRQQIAKAAVAEAKAMMNYAEITAPFDGVVTRKWADVGDLAAPGKPLVDLEDPSDIQMEADVPEAIAARVQKGSRLAVSVDTVSNALEGVVSELALAADPASRTMQVKLDLPQTAGLMTGQFARLVVPVGERNSVRVPTTAVVRRGQLELVFSVIDRHARLHLVKTGASVADEVEILSGLEPGQSVVTEGADQLTDGQPVEAR